MTSFIITWLIKVKLGVTADESLYAQPVIKSSTRAADCHHTETELERSKNEDPSCGEQSVGCCLRVCSGVVERTCWLPWLLRRSLRVRVKARFPLFPPSSRCPCSTATWRQLWTKSALAAPSWRTLCRKWERSCDPWERKVRRLLYDLDTVYFRDSLLPKLIDSSDSSAPVQGPP